jgi:GNAT superfamily N-acetyltransferase
MGPKTVPPGITLIDESKRTPIFIAAMTELRLARKADAAAIHALLSAAKDEIPLTYVKWVEDRCKRRAVWVIQENDEIAGAIIMRASEIYYLVVYGRHRRKGIGRALIAKAKEFCTDKRWDTLTARVRRTNAPILQLLFAEGFRLDPILQAAPDWDVYTWIRRPLA